MEKFIRSLHFPTPEMLEDTIKKLDDECIALNQLQSLSDEEFEEIGVSLQAAQLIREGLQELEKTVRHSTTYAKLRYTIKYAKLRYTIKLRSD